MIKMIDTHCHIFSDYYDNIDEVINKMNDSIIIVSGTNDIDNLEVIKLCNKYDNVYGTIGIHPTELDKLSDKSFDIIIDNINNPKIVGVGEIGLDYHYKDTNRQLQKEVFIKQIEIARKYNKSIVVHSRDAINDTYEILKDYADGLRKDIHCFAGSLDMAYKFIDIGSRLGVGGVLTFKNSIKLKEIVENIDIKYLLLETDSPFLSPEPLRGKRNEPYNIINVAKKIAEIKNESLENVLKITTGNAIDQFDLNLHI